MLQLEPTRHRDLLSNLPIYDLLLRILHDAEHTLQHIAFDQSYPSFHLVEAGKQMETHTVLSRKLITLSLDTLRHIRLEACIQSASGSSSAFTSPFLSSASWFGSMYKRVL